MSAAILSHLVLLAAGFALGLAFVPPRAARPGRRLLLALGFAPALAAGGSSIVFCACRALGLAAPGLLEQLVGTALAGAAVVASRSRARGAPRNHRTDPPTFSTGPALAGGLVALVPAALFVAASARSGSGGWDAHAWWNYLARALFRGYDRIPEVLHGTNYPLLLPGWIASQWKLAGAESELIPRLCATSCLVGCTALLVGGASRAGWPWSRGVPALLVVLGAAPVLRSAARQEADITVAYLVLAAGVALLLATEQAAPASLGALAGCLLGLLGWTKNEGAVWALALVFALAWTQLARRAEIRVRRPVVLAALAGGLVPFATWALYKLYWASERGQQGLGGALSSDTLALVATPSRWFAPLRALATTVAPSWSPGSWGVSATLVAALVLAKGVIAVRKRTSFEESFLLRFAFAFVPLLLVFYVATPYPQEWHLRSSFDRLFLQGFPLLALTAFTATSNRAQASGSPNDASPGEPPTVDAPA